jgi:hypothetical protein
MGKRRAVAVGAAHRPVLESRAPTVSAPGPQSPPAGVPPSGPDEFAGIRARRTRHPILAAATVALAGFLIFQIRSDVRYALSSAAPVEIDARSLARASPDNVPINRCVRLKGVPDRESALILSNRGSWKFTQFFRLLGTGNRAFVRRVPDPLPPQLAERDVFTGRLLRFADLSFWDSIRRHLVTHVSATHFFAPAILTGLLPAAGRTLTVPDLLGEEVALAPEDELAIDTAHPGDLRIELPGERFPGPEQARAAVVAQGGEVLSVAPGPEGRQVVTARLPPARRDAALTALADVDRRVHVAPARLTTRVRVGDLRPAPDGLLARDSRGTEVTLVRGEIQAVRTMAPLRIPAEAWLLVEDDRPRDHLHTLFISIFLLAFIAVNLMAVRRGA